MSIVVSSRMLVKRKSISRILIKNSEFCSTISLTKANEFFTVYSLLVKDFKIDTGELGTRYFKFCCQPRKTC